ncbi:hypothetical protein [Amycolatopsis sp. NPDC059021]|uniref:hypothetical protein n=1 Tax=Amycolatopsis sp. NPDC059021 TaxID=3346704 RepID=UPI00366F5FEC
MSTVIIIERYAARWSIEGAFADVKNTTGAGEVRNRTEKLSSAPSTRHDHQAPPRPHRSLTSSTNAAA